jgi:branched-chain amino acid transport system substrate-binding protein
MVEGLLEAGVLPYEIAIFSQNDAYGDAGYKGVIQGLEAAGYNDAWRLAHGRYERNTLDVKDALLTILKSPVRPRAIIMIGSYAPVVPHFSADHPLTRDYLRDLKELDSDAEPRFVSLDGYIVARIFVEGLRHAGKDINRESIIDALLRIRNLNFGLGVPIQYTHTHQSSIRGLKWCGQPSYAMVNFSLST